MEAELIRVQKHLDWLKTELYLNSIADKAKVRPVKRGEVYWFHIGYNVGSEMSKESPRPGVILQNNFFNIKSPNTIVAPITHSKSKLECLVKIEERFDKKGNLILDGKVNVANVLCVSKARLGDVICSLSKEEMNAIDKAYARQIDLIRYYQRLLKENEDKQCYINKLLDKRNKLKDDFTLICEAAGTKDINLIIEMLKRKS